MIRAQRSFAYLQCPAGERRSRSLVAAFVLERTQIVVSAGDLGMTSAPGFLGNRKRPFVTLGRLAKAPFRPIEKRLLVQDGWNVRMAAAKGLFR